MLEGEGSLRWFSSPHFLHFVQKVGAGGTTLLPPTLRS